MFRSWETSTAAISSFAVALMTLILVPYLDGNPDTVANWGAFMPILIANIGLMRARDNNKTSEQVGVK